MRHSGIDIDCMVLCYVLKLESEHELCTYSYCIVLFENA